MSSQLNFSVAVCIYKIHVFDEAFFLSIIRMSIVTKFFRVVTCCEEFLPINTHDISTEWSCSVTWQIKLYLQLQKMYQHHNRQSADLVVEAPKHDPLIRWQTWGHVIVWKIYISIFIRFIANKLGRLLALGRIFST